MLVQVFDQFKLGIIHRSFTMTLLSEHHYFDTFKERIELWESRKVFVIVLDLTQIDGRILKHGNIKLLTVAVVDKGDC